jgi:hypothetical protein
VARTAEIQIARPHRFLKHERTLQKAGVAVLTVFVAAGIAGAFGDGPLARTTTTGSTQIRYDRFGRTTAPVSVAISIATAAADGAPVRFNIDRAFLEDVELVEVRPPDALKRLDDVSALFEVPASGGYAHVALHYKPKRPGLFQTAIVPERGDAVQLRQLIYF